jgi:hypothetical protein
MPSRTGRWTAVDLGQGLCADGRVDAPTLRPDQSRD